MKQQGAHPEDTEGTPDASSRPDTAKEPGGAHRDVAHIDEVEGDEPLLPARVHRPSDLMRLVGGVLAVVVLLAVAAFAHGTTSGLEQDINKGTGQAPDLLIKIAGLASSSSTAQSDTRQRGLRAMPTAVMYAMTGAR